MASHGTISPSDISKRFNSDFLGNLQNAIGRRSGSSGYLSSASDEDSLSKSPSLDSTLTRTTKEKSVDAGTLWNLPFSQRLLDNSAQRHRIAISKWRSRRRPTTTSTVVDKDSASSIVAAPYLTGISEEPSAPSCQRSASFEQEKSVETSELKFSSNRFEKCDEQMIRSRSTDRNTKSKKRPVSLCVTSSRKNESSVIQQRSTITVNQQLSTPSKELETPAVDIHTKPNEDNGSSSDQKDYEYSVEYRNKASAKPSSSSVEAIQKRFSVVETSRLFGEVASTSAVKNFAKSTVMPNTAQNRPPSVAQRIILKPLQHESTSSNGNQIFSNKAVANNDLGETFQKSSTSNNSSKLPPKLIVESQKSLSEISAPDSLLFKSLTAPKTFAKNRAVGAKAILTSNSENQNFVSDATATFTSSSENRTKSTLTFGSENQKSSPETSAANSLPSKSIGKSAALGTKSTLTSGFENQKSSPETSTAIFLPSKCIGKTGALGTKSSPTSNWKKEKFFPSTSTNSPKTLSSTLSTPKHSTDYQTLTVIKTSPLPSVTSNELHRVTSKNSIGANRSLSVFLPTSEKFAQSTNTSATTAVNVVGLQRQLTITDSFTFSNIKTRDSDASQIDTPVVERDSTKRRNVQSLLQRFQQLEQKSS